MTQATRQPDPLESHDPAAYADHEHLKLLAIFHYVLGGIMLAAAFCPSFHLVFGLVMIFNPSVFEGQSGEPEGLLLMGGIMSAIAALMMLAGWVCGGLVIYAGRSIANRRRRAFCLVMAAIESLFIPLGTILGVFTIIVLLRPSVVRQFA